MTDEQWFYSFVDTSGGLFACWTWKGHLHQSGYGQARLRKRTYQAHRLAYELRFGLVPEGKELDHLCRNRACVNLTHLEAVDHQTNVQRAFADKMTCRNGHEYTTDNTIRYTSDNARRCRTCRLEQNKVNKQRYRQNLWTPTHRATMERVLA